MQHLKRQQKRKLKKARLERARLLRETDSLKQACLQQADRATEDVLNVSGVYGQALQEMEARAVAERASTVKFLQHTISKNEEVLRILSEARVEVLRRKQSEREWDELLWSSRLQYLNCLRNFNSNIRPCC